MRCRIFTDGILDRLETAINDFLKDIQYQTFLGSQMTFDPETGYTVIIFLREWEKVRKKTLYLSVLELYSFCIHTN
jgi:hypothetical protein